MDRSFIDADLDEIISKLTVQEKAALIAGKDFWRTSAIPRLNVPSIKVTDGPNGARGGAFLKMTPALCVPCGSALGCTFDPELVYEIGQVLAEETLARSAVVLLGPTLNICRSPAGGRAFESYSEDPVLSGQLTAAYTNGLQSRGIGATPKHYVLNDQEHERNAANASISKRALREVYLLAFQIALSKSDPWCLMTSYGKAYGTHLSESDYFLKDTMRAEFGYEGLIMSDWYGTYSTAAAINATLDLEMPGPTRWRRADLVIGELQARKLTMDTLDQRVKQVLSLVQRQAKNHPDVVYGEDTETTLDNKDHQAIARKAATWSIVLLKNDEQILPLQAGTTKSIAILGGSAKQRHYCGGGSAELGASYLTSPFDAIVKHLSKDISVAYEIGSWAHDALPFLAPNIRTTSGSNDVGCTLTFYAEGTDGKRAEKSAAQIDLPNSIARIFDSIPGGLKRPFQAVMTATYTADRDCTMEFGVIVAGRAILYVDDTEIVNLWTKQPPIGPGFFGTGCKEMRGQIAVQKGHSYRIKLDFSSEKPAGAPFVPYDGGAFCVGGFPILDQEAEIQKAVDLAKTVDVPVVVTGLSAELESEGFDRASLALPSGADKLIERVAKANPNTVVVVQSGSAVLMPWADKVKGLLWAPYGGNEGGNAVGEVLCGKVSPAGRLSMTFPKRDQDVPAYLDFRSEEGQINYSEGIYVGYKYYDARKIEPAFAFGHGISYTTFEYSNFKVQTDESGDSFKADASVTVKNSGKVRSSVSVLIYLSPPVRQDAAGLSHPLSTLQAFTHVRELEPGQSTDVHLALDKYAIAHYSQVKDTFTNEVGEWTARIGSSALIGDTLISTVFKVVKTWNWRGL